MERRKLLWLAVQVIVYYVISLGSLFAIIVAFPDAREYLPVGGMDRLGGGMDSLLVLGTGAMSAHAVHDRALSLLISLVGTLLFVAPLAWVYAKTRSGKHSGPMLETLFLLPIVVTSVIMVVQHSLVLAFSLFGVVAAVRFRNSLKTPADAVFVFASLSIGLAAGVSEIGVAGVASMVFSVTVIALRIFGIVNDQAGQAKANTDPTNAAERL